MPAQDRFVIGLTGWLTGLLEGYEKEKVALPRCFAITSRCSPTPSASSRQMAKLRWYGDVVVSVSSGSFTLVLADRHIGKRVPAGKNSLAMRLTEASSFMRPIATFLLSTASQKLSMAGCRQRLFAEASDSAHGKGPWLRQVGCNRGCCEQEGPRLVVWACRF